MKCFLNVSSQLFQIFDKSAAVRTVVLTEAAAAERIRAWICALNLGELIIQRQIQDQLISCQTFIYKHT